MLSVYAGNYKSRAAFWVGLFAVAMAFSTASAGPYPPGAGQPGSTAIHMDNPAFVSWATGIEVVRGPVDISDPGGGDASFGSPELALGPAGGDSFDVVSLGDDGFAVLTFATPIVNGPGFDFAVFENGFGSDQVPGVYFLEVGFVEVSSNGRDFFRFDAVSLTPTDSQVAGFAPLDPTDLHNLAGKYELGYGTPFDLDELAGSPGLNVDRIMYVRIIDVVGSIDDSYATYDSLGNKINDPWPTLFASSGFDLDAVGVINTVTCEGDFDFDADVDGRDLARLASGLQPLELGAFTENFGCSNCNR
jgi:hypothetical protein